MTPQTIFQLAADDIITTCTNILHCKWKNIIIAGLFYKAFSQRSDQLTVKIDAPWNLAYDCQEKSVGIKSCHRRNHWHDHPNLDELS